MLSLYWKTAEQTRSLVERPFASEAEFERYIFDNQDILGDVLVLWRQVHTGNKQGIPDMLGVDQDGRVCLIELKNVEADESILPRALDYAIWAETNPDSIKALWLESKDRPEDIQLDWDHLDIRVILIAPAFKRTVPRMAAKMGYPIDLVQMRRYCFEKEEFLLVDTLEEDAQVRSTATKAMRAWDWDFYASEHGEEATAQFHKAVDALTTYCEEQEWELPYNLNKDYVGFKLGGRIVFGVAWVSTNTWTVYIKLAEGRANGFAGAHWRFQSYDRAFHEAVFQPLDPAHPDVAELGPFLLEAYERISGKR